MTYRILLVGGGSGGHIYPLVAISQELQNLAKERGVSFELMVLADNENWRKDFESMGVRFKRILTVKFRPVEGGRINFLAFLKLPLFLIQSLWMLFLFMPDLVFSKGGFVSLVPSFVSRLYFIPLFIHESDVVPGKANKFLAYFAKKVFISFEKSISYFKNKNMVLSGNPIRETLFGGNKLEAAKYFNLSSNKKTILVMAGSQGSASINKLLIDSVVQLTEDFQIIHQTGGRSFDSVKGEIEKIKSDGSGSYSKDIENNYRVYDFLTEGELASAYALCDIIVSRAGSSIFEISYLGKPTIVIPYPYSAGDHQRANAIEFAKFGAVVLEEGNLKPNILIDQVEHLLKPENYFSISQKIRQFSNLNAGRIIADEIYAYAFRK
ncbi:MAG: hypothetical protein A2913_01660 [Parcubacteria group bacterium RIFCSPLOWO2_01_FULL_40_65]|nr:MAG: hypothetical protein A2734_00560 [Parcubacteria group bacterium RIFCSPHIGHO2_01_FULL_40_30]OHB21170.1 MAG: hypothetical protein A2913_01660 [Parcubacteria group bacterium RIFCSPLOWO2_01_FULL_40_65]OHB24067.1 MAG: hypothetical protein A3F96_02290 [Parcubacteria group bacterium RIFCSPLOWO2_12_FULL_40_10]